MSSYEEHLDGDEVREDLPLVLDRARVLERVLQTLLRCKHNIRLESTLFHPNCFRKPLLCESKRTNKTVARVPTLNSESNMAFFPT